MSEEDIKQNFSHNLLKLRKAKNITQSKLAEVLSYSDRAISKWEVGAVLPDVETMVRIADYFNVTINDLIYDKRKNLGKKFKLQHLVITLLSVVGVWFVATLVFFILQHTLPNERLWLVFIVAIPISFIVFVVFSSIWFGRIWRFGSISGLLWSGIITIYLFLNAQSFWFIFIVAIISQLLIILWYFLNKILANYGKS